MQSHFVRLAFAVFSCLLLSSPLSAQNPSVTGTLVLAFAVKGDRIAGHYRTNGEESFGDSQFTIDLTFNAPIEGT